MLQSAPLSGARERVLYMTAIAASANVSIIERRDC